MQNVQFTADRCVFKEDGTLRLLLFGIKNDYSREGFEVPVVPAKIAKICLVQTLRDWLDRTKLVNSDVKRPVFFHSITLTQPCHHLP